VNLKEKIFEMIDKMVSDLVDSFISEKIHPEDWDWDGLLKAVSEIIPVTGIEDVRQLNKKHDVKDALINTFKQAYEGKEVEVGSENMRQIEKLVMLRVIDSAWIDQLHNMDALREGIGLRAYGQRDPLIEYKIEGFSMFNDMMKSVRMDVVGMILKVQLASENEPPKQRAVSFSRPQEDKSSKPHGIKKIGRNEPCPCGSGKKYKKCCGRNE
jgi:preprotein translocase subunit SecA